MKDVVTYFMGDSKRVPAIMFNDGGIYVYSFGLKIYST